VHVITALGADDSYEDFIRSKLAPNVSLSALLRPGAVTTRKIRTVDPSCMRKIGVEVYVMDEAPLETQSQRRINSAVRSSGHEYDLAIAADFGHGLIVQSTMDRLWEFSMRLAVNAQTNSANHGYNIITKYPGAHYICVDEPEARLALRDRASPVTDIAQHLFGGVPFPKVIITRGKHGCVTWDGDTTHTLPALCRNVVDTVGAGDAFFAVTAPLVAAGGPMHHIGFIGNVVGAIKVGIVGNRTAVDKAALVKSITGLLK
jgi:bifunctional ADP-heptose synthase (sugar kinase/adenylyltransferase)